ncbi:MAG: hypothetical protein HOV80_03920 [Polyangiaceae bacterium]|nr:hypothetical protein [Polyangiaceae bacterium]
MTKRGVALALLFVACGDKTPTTSSASAPAPLALSAAPKPPGALAICDSLSADDHACFEFEDEELATERARVCPTGIVRDARCPTKDRMSSCRLPDGSIRYGYPPRTTAQHEKHCKEARGKFSPTGTAPPPDPKALFSCRGKHKGACEEELTFTTAREEQAKDDCLAFGGLFAAGEACVRDRAIATCDLEGKKTIVFYPEAELEEANERVKFCETRFGKYAALTPEGAPSASAGPSAGPAPSAGPPP